MGRARASRHAGSALLIAGVSVLAALATAPDVPAVPRKKSASAKLERAAAKKLRGLLKQLKRETKAASRDAARELKELRKAITTGRGLEEYGVVPEAAGSVDGPVTINATGAVVLTSYYRGVRLDYTLRVLSAQEASMAAARGLTEVQTLLAGPDVCELTSEGGLLRAYQVDLSTTPRAFGSKLERPQLAVRDALAAADRPFTHIILDFDASTSNAHDWLRPAEEDVGGALSARPLQIDTGPGRRIVCDFTTSPVPLGMEFVMRGYRIDGTFVSEARAQKIGGTRTREFYRVRLPAPGDDHQYWIRLFCDPDGAGGAPPPPVPLFWQQIVIPDGGGDDGDEPDLSCSFTAQDLAFANLGNVRHDAGNPVEATMTVRGNEITDFDLKFVKDVGTPSTTLRFSVVPSTNGVPIGPAQGTGTHVEVRITPDVGALPDVMLDPTGGGAINAYFLDPGDEYEILMCFSVDPRTAPAGSFPTKIRIVGRGRAGVLFAAPYQSFSFDFAYDGVVTLTKQ